MAVEADGMHLRAILAQTEACLTRRTSALERAREAIDVQHRRIVELEQQLAARGTAA
jgi:hypothetical protein